MKRKNNMTEVKRKFDVLSKEKKESLIKEVITYFKSERDEEIGVIAAEDILDFFLEALVPDVYNKGVSDAKALVKQGFDNLEIDLEVLLNK